MNDQTTLPPRNDGRRYRLVGFGTTLLFVGAIAAGSVLGTVLPSAGASLGNLIDYTILLLVCLLVFEVRLTGFRPERSAIRFLFIAWVANFIFIPAIGCALASLFLSGQPLFRTGLVIYFMAPCTDWFLGFTRLARGNTALGAVLLPINMTSQLLLYPVFIALYAGGSAPVDVAGIGNTLLHWFLLPFVIAIVLRLVLNRVLSDGAMAWLLDGVRIAIPVVIALLIMQIFAAHIAVILGHADVFAIMLLAVFMFFVTTFILGEGISKIARLTYPEHALLTMTTAARNAPMMLGITVVAMPDQPLVYAAIIIGMLVEFPHLTALRQILLRKRGNMPVERWLRQGSSALR